MIAIFYLVLQILKLYSYVVIANVIVSWLIAFNIVNTTSNLINLIGNFLYKVTEPILRPIRRVLPDFGGVDVSPVILIILLIFFRNLLFEYSGVLNFS